MIVRRLRRLYDRLHATLFSADVFISYARKDAAYYATELGRRLQENDLAVYLDQYASWPNKRLPRELLRELRAARMMVVVGSARSLRSPAVRCELRMFLRLGRAVVPIVVEPENGIEDEAWRREPWQTIRGAHGETEPKASIDDGRVSPRVVERILSSITFATRARRQRAIAFATAVFVVIGAAFLVAALYNADRSAADARASSLAAESMSESERHPHRALALAVAAHDAAPERVSVDTRRALFTPIERYSRVRRFFAPDERVRIGGGGFNDQDISRIAVTPDGKTLIAGTGAGTVSFHDTSAAKPAGYAAHSGRVMGIAVSPDGRHAVTATGTNELVLWDVPERKRMAAFRATGQTGWTTPWFADDDHIVGAGISDRGPTITEWRVTDVAHPSPPRVLIVDAACPAGKSPWVAIAFARDVPRVAIWTGGRVLVFDWKTGRLLHCVPEARHHATRVALSADGKQVAWSGGDEGNVVTVADVDWRAQVNAFVVRDAVNDLAFDDRGRLAVASSGLLVREDVQRTELPYVTDVPPISLAMHRGSLFAGYRDETVAQWTLDAAAQSVLVPLYAEGDYYRVSFSPDGRQLFTGRRDAVTVFDVRTRKIVGSRKPPARFDAVSGHQWTGAKLDNGTLRIVDIQRGTTLREIRVGDDAGRVGLSYDGRDVAVGDSHGRVVLYRRDGTEAVLRTEDLIGAVAVSARGEFVAASTLGKTLVWDGRSGVPFMTLPMHAQDLAFSPDGRLLAGAYGKFVRINAIDVRVWRDVASAMSPRVEEPGVAQR